jgi:hypothetical protein
VDTFPRYLALLDFEAVEAVTEVILDNFRRVKRLTKYSPIEKGGEIWKSLQRSPSGKWRKGANVIEEGKIDRGRRSRSGGRDDDRVSFLNIQKEVERVRSSGRGTYANWV